MGKSGAWQSSSLENTSCSIVLRECHQRLVEEGTPLSQHSNFVFTTFGMLASGFSIFGARTFCVRVHPLPTGCRFHAREKMEHPLRSET